jgi:hypothetical protein
MLLSQIVLKRGGRGDRGGTWSAVPNLRFQPPLILPSALVPGDEQRASSTAQVPSLSGTVEEDRQRIEHVPAQDSVLAVNQQELAAKRFAEQ